MNSQRSKNLKVRLMLADAVAFCAGVILAFQLQVLVRPVPVSIAYEHLLLVALAVPFLVAAAGVNRLYQARANERPSEEIANILKTIGVGVVVILVAGFALQYEELSRLWVFLFAVSTVAALVAERLGARAVFSNMRMNGQLRRRIVVVGTDPHAISIMHTYKRNPGLGYEVVGFAGDDVLGDRGGIEVLGPVSDLSRILHECDAVGVVVSLASVASDEVNAFTRELTDEGFHVVLSSSLRDIDLTRLRPQQLDGRAMIYVEPTMRDGWRAVSKRVYDVVVATLLLVFTLPILAMAAIAIKIGSRGPVFFHQVRVGRHGQLFRITKFRTMVVDAEDRRAELEDHNESDGPLFKMKDDPRVTGVGHVLRKLSIDELPQLYCVLAGAMSMVGPRPALPDEVAQWDVEVAERLRVPPGLTGMWQVSGRSNSSFDDYKRLDLYYVDNWSLKHDVEICLRTVRVVLTGRGAA
jgi:exopolysaccharide biosynthesis polyprenyl glycosylphosphotransferase